MKKAAKWLMVAAMAAGMAATLAAQADVVTYVDIDGSTKILEEGCTEITASTTTLSNGKWYAVRSDVTIPSRITVSGNVNLILCNGATLTATKGIGVPSDATLVIWAQSKGDGAGKLTVTEPDERCAGIGSGDFKNAGTITVNGGILDVSGGERAAGIGGGNHGDVTKVNINGGAVTAQGGLYGAGIGGGNCGNGTVEITGGTVVARGGGEGAGIGGGDEMPGGTITITGGNVEAHGGEKAAGIGGGGPKDESGRAGGKITITGGKVKAQGGQYSAGIGGGRGGNGGEITVEGGEVTANGNGYGAGIGGGERGNGAVVTITGGTVIANGGDYGAGIGSGFGRSSNVDGYHGGTVTISNGTVRAAGGGSAAGIGGGYFAKGADVTIYGGTVVAFGEFSAAGIGGGRGGSGGTLTVTGGDVTAQGNLLYNGHFGQSTASPIGIGCNGANPGTITFGEVRVTTDKSETPTDFVTASLREETCRQFNSWVRIVECPGHDFSNHYCNYCGAKDAMTYADAEGNEMEPIPADQWTQIESGTEMWSDGWYATGSGDDHGIEISSRVTVSGNVNLILGDGADLKIPKGITVPEGASLTIWRQSTMNFGVGKLTVAGPDDEYAGIGGGGYGKKSGTIVVNGGVLDVTGGDKAAGIGGGNHASATAITINGGEVTARGSRWAAGVGGGNCGGGGIVTVNGGTVVATGGSDAEEGGGGAGIGGGDEMPGDTVEINGGVVEAYGGDRSAGIGAGGDKNKSGRSGGIVKIRSGTVTAVGGKYGAGIGGGNYGDGGTVEVSGGTVTATAGAGTGRAIGRGDAGNADGSLALFDRAKVTAGANAGSAVVAAASERVSAAQTSSYARIEPCTVHDYVNGSCTSCAAVQPVSFSVTIPAKGAQIVSLPLVTAEGAWFKFGDTAFAVEMPVQCGVLFWDEARQGWSGGVKGPSGWDTAEANHVVAPGEGFALVNPSGEAITVTVTSMGPSAASLGRDYSGGNKWCLMAYPYPVAQRFGDTQLAIQLLKGSSVKFWNAAAQAWTDPMEKSGMGWSAAAANHTLQVGEAFFIRTSSEGFWEEFKPE